MYLQRFQLGLILLCVFGLSLAFAGGAIAQTEFGIGVEENETVIDVTHSVREISKGTVSRNPADGAAPTPKPGKGSTYKLHFLNPGTDDLTRVLVFRMPDHAHTGIWGSPARMPRIESIRVNGEPVGFRPTRHGSELASAIVRIPAGGEASVVYGLDGSDHGLGIYLWETTGYRDFQRFSNWQGGIFLGVAMVLLVFALGLMLLLHDRASLAFMGFAFSICAYLFVHSSATEWLLTFSSAPVQVLYPLSTLLVAFLLYSFLRSVANDSARQGLAHRLMIGFAAASFVAYLLSSFGVPILGWIARIAFLAYSGFFLLWLLYCLKGRAFDRVGIAPSIFILMIAAVLETFGPSFEWGINGVFLELAINVALLLASCLLCFSMMMALGDESRPPLPGAIENDFASEPMLREPPRLEPEFSVADQDVNPSPQEQEVEPETPSLAEENRYELGVAASHQGLWDWEIDGDNLYLSPSIDGLLGLPTGGMERTEQAWCARIHEEDRDTYRNAMRSYLERGNVSFSMEFRLQHEDGSWPWFQLRATCLPGDDGYASRCIGILTNITQLKLTEQRMHLDATLDPLTGLSNRTGLMDRLGELLKNGTGPAKGALIVINLDRFRNVNDGLGHLMGDLLLIQIGERLISIVDHGGLVARIGNDEFGVLLDHETADPDGSLGHGGPAAEELASLVIDIVSQPVDLDGQEVFSSASAGIVHFEPGHSEPEDVLKDAEAAMYRAKRGGGGRYEIYDSSMRQSSDGTLALESDLRRALQRRQIEVLFQPIMDMISGRIAGFEALLRWNHPDRGVLSPDQFVSMAEETNMIVPLGRFALSMASLQLEQWQMQYPSENPLFVSVNVSGRQLKRAGFAADVEEILNATSLVPQSLKVEVTESLILDDPEIAYAQMQRIKELGAGVALDDFGTGFASLSNLQKYPFDTIKVDRSFVSTMESRNDSSVIVNSIVSLANQLGLSVIAEGLESEEDAILLREMGCRYGQGFVFGAPMTATEAQNFIAQYTNV